MTASVILVEASPRQPADGAAVTVRLAGGGAKMPYHYGGEHWRAGIAALPKIITSLNWPGDDIGTGGVPQALSLDWSPARRADLDALASLYWTDAAITVRLGAEGQALPPLRLVGTVLEAPAEPGKLTLAMADPAAGLKVPFLVDRFAGTGGVEGPSEWAGRIRRRAIGRCFNILGDPIDKAHLIYCFGDPARSWQAFDAVRVRGVAAQPGELTLLAWQGSVAATFAALQAASVPNGGGVLCPSIACIKWWTEPASLCADVRGEVDGGYVETAPEIVARLVAARSAVAFAAGTVAAAKAARPMACGLFVDEDRSTVAELLDQLLGDVSLLWVLDGGQIAIRRWEWGVSVASGRSAEIKRLKVHKPVGSRKLGYRRNQHKMARGDIAAILLASDVAFGSGETLEQLKPAEPGATNSADPGSPFGNDGKTVGQTKNQIGTLQNDVDGLFNVFGSTQSAAASAAEAEQAKADALAYRNQSGGFAESASHSSDDAGQHAQDASAQAQIALARSQDSYNYSQASLGHAQAADTSAYNAEQKASAAELSSLTARVGAAQTFPSGFSPSERPSWVPEMGTPDRSTIPVFDPSYFGGAAGDYYFQTKPGETIAPASRGTFKPEPGRRYRARIEVEKTAAVTNGRPAVMYYGFTLWTAAGGYITGPVAALDLSGLALNARTIQTYDWAPAAGDVAGVGFATLRAHMNWDNGAGAGPYSDGVWRIHFLGWEDITSQKAAADSADASIQAKSDAQAARDDAGNSAGTSQYWAGQSNTHAGEADSHAQAAQGAQTAAETARDAAGNHAQTSLYWSGQAETHSGNSYNSAQTSIQQAGVATDKAAAATQSATVAANVSLRSINANPAFSNYPNASGEPDQWTGWSYDSGFVPQRVAGKNGAGFALRESANANLNQGGAQFGTGDLFYGIAGGWYVVEAEFKLLAGTLRGAGVWVNSSRWSDGSYLDQLGGINFAADPDSTGFAQGDGTNNRVYRFSKLLHAPADFQRMNLHRMTSWEGFGQRDAKTLDWYQCSIRPATQQEIRDQTVLAPLYSQVQVRSDALATVEGRLAGTHQIRILAGTSETSLEGYNDGVEQFWRFNTQKFYIVNGAGQVFALDGSQVRMKDVIIGRLQVESLAIGTEQIEPGATMDVVSGSNPTGFTGNGSAYDMITIPIHMRRTGICTVRVFGRQAYYGPSNPYFAWTIMADGQFKRAFSDSTNRCICVAFEDSFELSGGDHTIVLNVALGAGGQIGLEGGNALMTVQQSTG